MGLLFTNCLPELKSFLNGDVRVLLEMSALEEVVQLLCQYALFRHRAENSNCVRVLVCVCVCVCVSVKRFCLAIG